MFFLLGSGECIFSESSATCFGATGQPVIFHLSYKRGTSIVTTKDDKHRILKISNQGKVTLDKEYVNQSDSIDTVILKVGEASKKHSGHYQLEEHDHDGKLLKKINVYLKIQGKLFFVRLFVCFVLNSNFVVFVKIYKLLRFIKRLINADVENLINVKKSINVRHVIDNISDLTIHLS